MIPPILKKLLMHSETARTLAASELIKHVTVPVISGGLVAEQNSDNGWPSILILLGRVDTGRLRQLTGCETVF